MEEMQTNIEDYSATKARGEVIERSGYHQPQDTVSVRRCDCDYETRKGAYRDVAVELMGTEIVYLHQNPIVLKSGNTMQLYSRGYRTRTTKSRLNEHTPSGYSVIQRDSEWYVDTPDGRDEFEEGYKITE
jgi:hypothetical protein